MSSENRLGLRQTQTQRLSPNTGLVTSLGVLRADAAGLTRYLEEQAAQNPHLVLEPPMPPAAGEWLPRWTFMLGQGGNAGVDFAQSAGPSLIAHVAEHIQARLHSARDRTIALVLAESLEPSGWLGRPLAEMAAEAGCSLPEIEAVLVQVQTVEPAGLFARSLADCLRLQLVEAGQMDAAFAVILAHLDLLAKGEMARLARLAGIGEPDLLRRFRTIRALDPKPGMQFATFGAEPVREPDLLVVRDAEGVWSVALNRSALPSLSIRKSETGDAAALTAARALGRMVAARNATLLRVGREILQRQEPALEQGPGALMPLTMAEVAAALELAESTVSRVVAGASVDTPHGTWWLRRLFSRRVAMADEDGEAVSTAALRERMAKLVAAEPKGKPLSDESLARMLSAEGTPVARRTVAKYRGLLGIAPAHRRRRAGW